MYINIYIHTHTHTHTMEYHSAIKRNEFKSVPVSGMNLKPVIQSKVSQKDKNKHHILTHLYIYIGNREKWC